MRLWRRYEADECEKKQAEREECTALMEGWGGGEGEGVVDGPVY